MTSSQSIRMGWATAFESAGKRPIILHLLSKTNPIVMQIRFVSFDEMKPQI